MANQTDKFEQLDVYSFPFRFGNVVTIVVFALIFSYYGFGGEPAVLNLAVQPVDMLFYAIFIGDFEMNPGMGIHPFNLRHRSPQHHGSVGVKLCAKGMMRTNLCGQTKCYRKTREGDYL